MKQIVKNYTFSTSGKTVTLTDFSTIRLDRVLLIVDATINAILYNYADSSVTTATVATNVITLGAVPGGAANGDSLIIFYDQLSGDANATIYDGGQRTMAASRPVVIASDQTSLPFGAGATGSAVPANATYIAGINGGNLTGIQVIGGNGDGTSNSLNSLLVTNFPSVFNGSSWDRMRGATSAAATSGAGLLGAGMLGIYNSSAPAPSSGNYERAQLDQAANQRVFPGIALTTLSGWTSGTSVNATQNIFTNSGAEAVLVQVDQTTTITGGAITFEVTYDGANWVAIPANCVLDPTSTTYAQISLPYTLVASTNKPFLIINNGWQGLRIKLSTAITGSATVTPNYALLPFSPAAPVVALSPTASNFQVASHTQDGSGNSITSNSTTTTSNRGLDANILSILGTAPTTAGKLDIKGASGDVTVYAKGNAGAAFDAATNAAPPANAVLMGGVAATALPSAYTATDLAPPMLDKFGRQVTLVNAMRDLVNPITQLTLTSTTTETTLISAVASTFNDILSLVVINTSATATQVDFRDSTGGTIRLSLYVPAGDTRGITLSTPLPQNAVNNNWTAKCGTSVASVIITGSYVANK